MKYCLHCGHKQELKTANFCSSCGEPLSKNAISNHQKPSTSKSKAISDDETDATCVPNIDKLDVNVELPSNVVGISNRNGKIVFESSKFKKRTLEL